MGNDSTTDKYMDICSKILDLQQQLVLNQQRDRIPNFNDFFNFEQYANEFYMVCSHLNSTPDHLIELCTQQLRGPALEAALLYKEFNITDWNQFVHYMIRMVDGNNLQRNIDERSVTQYSTPGRNFTAYALKKYRIAKLHCEGCTEKGLLNIVLMSALSPIRRYLTPKVDNNEITSIQQLITTAQEIDNQLHYYREAFNQPMNSTPPKFNQSHQTHMDYQPVSSTTNEQVNQTTPKSIEQAPTFNRNPTYQHKKPFPNNNQRYPTTSNNQLTNPNNTTQQEDQITITRILNKYQLPNVNLNQENLQSILPTPPPRPTELDTTEIDEQPNVFMIQCNGLKHPSSSEAKKESKTVRNSKRELNNELKNLLTTVNDLIKKAKESTHLTSTEENSCQNSIEDESEIKLGTTLKEEKKTQHCTRKFLDYPELPTSLKKQLKVYKTRKKSSNFTSI